MPSTTVRVEDINQYVGSVHLSPIDMLEKTFVVEENISFDPLKLDFECPEKEKIAKAVLKMLKKKIIDVSMPFWLRKRTASCQKKILMRRSNGLTKTKSAFLIIDIRCHIE